MSFDMPPRPWYPRTRFVRDRLRETPYENRDYIAALLAAESLCDGHAVQGFAGNLAKRTLLNSYPAECSCIRSELQDGIYTSPQEFHRLRANADAVRRQTECAAELAAKEEEQRDREWWQYQSRQEADD